MKWIAYVPMSLFLVACVSTTEVREYRQVSYTPTVTYTPTITYTPSVVRTRVVAPLTVSRRCCPSVIRPMRCCPTCCGPTVVIPPSVPDYSLTIIDTEPVDVTTTVAEIY